VEAGLIKLPYPVELPLNFGLPKDLVPASLAETMLLALEERFVNYSVGLNMNLDKLEEIADVATKHGFEVWAPDAPVL
jgi:predicted amino acid dehydrogenase